VNRREDLSSITTLIREQCGIMNAESYGEEKARGSEGRRDAILRRFSSEDGDCDVLVATSVLGRGLDVRSIRWVINFDSPFKVVEYVHRIGRTGRAGDKGNSLTLLEEHDLHVAKDLRDCLQASDQIVPSYVKRACKNWHQFRELHREFLAKQRGEDPRASSHDQPPPVPLMDSQASQSDIEAAKCMTGCPIAPHRGESVQACTSGPLPDGWTKHWNEEYKCYFFRHALLQKSQWEFPEAAVCGPGSEIPDACRFKLVEKLHLGLHLQLGAVYTACDLRRRCGSDCLKLDRLNQLLRDGIKLVPEAEAERIAAQKAEEERLAAEAAAKEKATADAKAEADISLSHHQAHKSLPDGWTKHWNEEHKCYFFWHAVLQKSQWEIPEAGVERIVIQKDEQARLAAEAAARAEAEAKIEAERIAAQKAEQERLLNEATARQQALAEAKVEAVLEVITVTVIRDNTGCAGFALDEVGSNHWQVSRSDRADKPALTHLSFIQTGDTIEAVNGVRIRSQQDWTREAKGKNAFELKLHRIHQAGKVYLPIKLDGVTVLRKVEGNEWQATNQFLAPDTLGLGYRSQKHMEAKMGFSLLPWQSSIQGVDQGDGWVRVAIPMQERHRPSSCGKKLKCSSWSRFR
jgi:hypothetical protein